VGGAFVARGFVTTKATPASTELAKTDGEGLECGATGCAHEARAAAKAPAPALLDLGGSSPRVLEFSSKSCPACERMASVVKAVERACAAPRGTVVPVSVDDDEGEALASRYAVTML